VAAELFVESIGLGDKRNDNFWTAPHVASLGLMLACAFAVATHWRSLWRRSTSLPDFKRHFTLEVVDLPFRRRAWMFFALLTSIVLVGGLCAQLAEGSPALSHDALAWLLAALLLALFAAVAVRWCMTALPRLVSAMISFLAISGDVGPPHPYVRPLVSAVDHCDIWSAPLFNRPPPAFQL